MIAFRIGVLKGRKGLICKQGDGDQIRTVIIESVGSSRAAVKVFRLTPQGRERRLPLGRLAQGWSQETDGLYRRRVVGPCAITPYMTDEDDKRLRETVAAELKRREALACDDEERLVADPTKEPLIPDAPDAWTALRPSLRRER